MWDTKGFSGGNVHGSGPFDSDVGPKFTKERFNSQGKNHRRELLLMQEELYEKFLFGYIVCDFCFYSS